MPADMTTGRFVRKAVVAFIGLTVVVGSMTILFLGMRQVMDIGGYCASGGPYVVAHQCPKGSAWMMPVSIWVGLAGLGLYIVGDIGLPGPKLAGLAWPALFLSLGWNFWEYGLNPPSDFNTGIEWGWVICGVVFFLMGGLPLVALASPQARHHLLWSDGAEDHDSSVRNLARTASPIVPPPGTVSASTFLGGALRGPAAPPSGRPSPTPGANGPAPRPSPSGAPSGGGVALVDELERLAALFRNDELTVDEYQAAKKALLGKDHG